MSWINIHSNTSVIDRYHRDWCLHHYPYKMKICIEGLKILVSYTVSHSQLQSRMDRVLFSFREGDDAPVQK